MNGLLDRTDGERPRASRIIRALRLDLPTDLRGRTKYIIRWNAAAIQIGPFVKSKK